MRLALPRYARVCQVRVLRDPVTWGEDHEKNQKTTMRKVFFSERGWKTSHMQCLCPGLHLVTWCDTRKSTICRVHHSTKGKDGIYTEWYIHSLRLRRLLTKVVMLTWCPVPLNSMSSKIISPPPATPPWLRRIKGKVTGKGQTYTRPTKRVFNIHIVLKLWVWLE